MVGPSQQRTTHAHRQRVAKNLATSQTGGRRDTGEGERHQEQQRQGGSGKRVTIEIVFRPVHFAIGASLLDEHVTAVEEKPKFQKHARYTLLCWASILLPSRMDRTNVQSFCVDVRWSTNSASGSGSCFSCNFDVSDDVQLSALEFRAFERGWSGACARVRLQSDCLRLPRTAFYDQERWQRGEGGFNNFSLGQEWSRRSLLGGWQEL